MYQVLIVDNHPTVGAGTKFVLEQNKECFVTYVKTGALALEIVKKIKFDIMLCDLYVNDMDSMTLVQKILNAMPEMKILIFTGFAYEHVFNELIELGVSGILSKTLCIEELRQKIVAALKGETIIPTHLFKRMRAIEAQMVHETSNKLSYRERHITTCLINGYSNREIAEQVYLSQRAVEYQLKKLYKKFNVQSRAELLKYVSEHKLLEKEYWHT